MKVERSFLVSWAVQFEVQYVGPIYCFTAEAYNSAVPMEALACKANASDTPTRRQHALCFHLQIGLSKETQADDWLEAILIPYLVTVSKTHSHICANEFVCRSIPIYAALIEAGRAALDQQGPRFITVHSSASVYSLLKPRQRHSAPGSPSSLRPTKPPNLPTMRTAFPKDGGVSGGTGFFVL